jgi:PleD family two-component response regulator
VDDDKAVAGQIHQRLTSAGHSCCVFTRAEKVIAMPGIDDVNLIILDVMLPGVSGFELCRQVRATEALSSIPIIFLSAMDGQEEIDHGLSQGADDYLTKPFTPETLVRRVENLLAAHEQTLSNESLLPVPGPRRIKTEVQSAIRAKRTFAFIYIELMGLSDLGRTLGAEARDVVLRHFARGLLVGQKEKSPEQFSAGHMGSGHFVVLVEPNRADAYCASVQKKWLNHLEDLYAALPEKTGASPAVIKSLRAQSRMLEILVCRTIHEGGANLKVRELFDILTRLRNNALSANDGSIHIDRRG